MSENRKRLPVADQIRKGLEQAIRHAKGEITLKTTVVEIPDPPPEIQPDELTKLRLDNRMSQDVFARAQRDILEHSHVLNTIKCSCDGD